MLSNDPGKTKSAPKRLYAKLLIITGLVLVILVAGWWLATSRSASYPRLQADRTLTVAGRQYELQLADTAAERERGLGSLSGMPADQGMVFVFDTQDRQCFWMKDTLFALDMIWLDTDKRVTHIQPRVSPATFPSSFCGTGQYVIELHAGQAAEAGITTGQRLDF